MKKILKLNSTKADVTLNAIKTIDPEKGVIVYLRTGSSIEVPNVTHIIIDNYHGRLHLLDSGKTVMVVGCNEWIYFRMYQERAKK